MSAIPAITTHIVERFPNVNLTPYCFLGDIHPIPNTKTYFKSEEYFNRFQKKVEDQNPE